MGDSGDMSGRHAFVASVPFTLMEAIHFTLTYDLDADVYITKSYTDAANVAERLKTTKCIFSGKCFIGVSHYN